MASFADTLHRGGTLRGVLLMTLAGAFFAAMHSGIKYTAGEIHPIEIAFFRAFLSLPMLLPVVWRLGFRSMWPRRPGLMLTRGLLQSVSMMAWFSALALIPLAEATALNFTVPVITAAAAVFVYREAPRPHRWIAIALGFAGALIVIRPGFQVINDGTLLVLAAAVSLTFARLIVKTLLKTESNAAVVAWLGLVVSPVTFVASLFVWTWPTPEQFALLVFIAAMGTGGHLCWNQAYRDADIAAVEPLTFVRLIFAALFGYLLFAEVPTLWTWLGAGTIIAGATLLAVKERKPAAP